MVKLATLARWDYRFRPFIIKCIAPKDAVGLYSWGRIYFLDRLKDKRLSQAKAGYRPPENFSRVLWGIKFRTSLINAAGVFKNGECYDLMAYQGAGGYLGGTGTWNARRGNEKDGIYLPFVPYPRSHAASNWLGLPNDGDEKNAMRASGIVHASADSFLHCPVGWSVMGSPDLEGERKLARLAEAMRLYDKAGVDFLEMNESCPNTGEGTPQNNDLANRLRYIKENFLDRRERRLPVVVKFSNDTEIEQVPPLLDLLFELGFDGVNFGNTSINYSVMREKIHHSEQNLYDFFVSNFGGGVSGAPLKEKSLALCARAVEYRKAGPPAHEFHIIRTGGIEGFKDVKESEAAGISLNQWFTGYWESFARYGHDVYRHFFNG